MASKRAIDMGATLDGLPRRRAIQGIAGSVAGIATLSAMSASGKKKKKGGKGTLVRIEAAESTESIPLQSELTVTATCPAAGKKEEVFAISGGFDTSTAPNSEFFFVRAFQPSNDFKSWSVTFANLNNAPENATTLVLCAYFKTK